MPINMANAQSNYVASASLAGQKYKQKVSANTTWYANATAPTTQTNWTAAVTRAAAENLFTKGLQKSSQAAWQTAASTTGAAALPAGMTSHAQKWATDFAPFAAVIDSAVASLPARGVGAAVNIQRVLLIDQALENAKAQGA
jgi:hypothetical protein